MEPKSQNPGRRRWARTKIVATVGPACRETQKLSEIVSAGADLLRLNMAHGSPELYQPIVDDIRQISRQLDQPIAILADLAGPKIRLQEIDGGSIFCHRDEEFFFVRENPADSHELTSTYLTLVDELAKGDVVMLADGTVSMLVEEAKAGRVRLRVIEPGTIRSRQGINLPDVRLSAPAISVEDYQHAIWAAKAGIDYVSLSFVRSPDEVRTLKDIVRSNGSRAGIIAKIEKREALNRLDEIVAEADGAMVARGDLGVEIDVARIPLEQKRIVRACQEYQKPSIIATQMLDSMQDSPRPTRAEATDVANAILDGADACMLSGETAIGQYPREAVEMMNRSAVATEEMIAGRPPREAVRPRADNLQEITRAVVRGAGTMAYSLNAKLVVVASHSGRTAQALSQQRSWAPTIGVSTSEATLRKMCLYWGVRPLRGAPATNVEQLIRHADAWARAEQLAQPGDRLIIVGGSHLAAGPEGAADLAAGIHDIVIVHQVEAATGAG
ncbi:MAG: pyruvate kinase [Pirellulales bacterium]|nr:pyruvate kinase [Pirellulales bacterium]